MLDLSIDKRGGNLVTHNNAQKVLLTEIGAMEMNDIWRDLHPEVQEFTWRKLKPKPIFVRLDFFLISNTLAQFVLDCSIQPSLQSDHSWVHMTIALELADRGPGYWKFNTALLKDKEYVQKIGRLLEIEIDSPLESYKDKWKQIKLAIRGSTLQYSSRKKKSRDKQLEVLYRKLNCLEKAKLICHTVL